MFDLLESVKDIQIIENINTPLAPIVRDFIDKYVFVSRYVIDNFADASIRKTVSYIQGLILICLQERRKRGIWQRML